MSAPRVDLVVNGARHVVDPRPAETLAAVLHLRHDCADGTCGACTVLMDGEPTRACLVFAVQCGGAEVRTGDHRPSAPAPPESR